MLDLGALSDVEFEALCGDLIYHEHGTQVERFPRGRDGGIDLRWQGPNGLTIGQCKHYARSRFSELKRASNQEVEKVRKLDPDRYLLFTSQNLSVGRKQELYDIFSQWMKSPGDIFGADDIDAMLQKHTSVQKAHPKLWLHSGTQLYLSLHTDSVNRSNELVRRAGEDMQKFVPTHSFTEAQSLLNKEHVCVIAGAPGVGKTMLAHAMVADAARENFEIYDIYSDINEAWTHFNPDKRQLFLYDDFLGQISLSERLGKNEDKNIVRFMRVVAWV